MDNREKTREELLSELSRLQSRVKDLESTIEGMTQGDDPAKPWYLFKDIFENTGTAIAILSEDGTIISVNNEFLAMTGLAKEEAEGKITLFELAPEGESEKIKENHYLRRVNPAAAPRNYETRILTRDGQEKDVYFTASMLPEPGQSVVSMLDISSRKKVVRALKDSEIKFRSYITAALDGIFVVDEEGGYLDANPAGCEMLGYSKEELLQKKIDDVSPGIEESQDPGIFKRLVETGKSLGEALLVKKDGSLIYAEINAVALGNGRFLGLTRDVTKRKQAEEALRKSEQKYKTYLNESIDGILVVNGEGRILEANPSVCQHLGYTQEELQTMAILDIVPDDSGRQAATAHFERLKENGKSRGPVPHQAKDGRRIIFDIYGITFGEDRYMGFFRDISGLIEAEEALRQSERKLNLIVNGITDLVCLLRIEPGPNFRVITANQAALAFYGFSEEMVNDMLIQDIFPPDTTALMYQHYLKSFRSGKSISYQEELNTGILQKKTIPIFNQANECTHLICTGRDVTREKMMEEELAKAGKIESLGVLAGDIALDFNSIVSEILSNISSAKVRVGEGNLNHIYKVLNDAEKAAFRAKDLSLELLGFARGGEPAVKTTSIAELLKDMTHFVTRGTNCLVEFEISSETWLVSIDEAQVSQVIHNIVDNAVHVTPEGGTVKVSAENIIISGFEALPLDEGSYVRISIRDWGPGIHPDHGDRVFEPYFTTKEAGAGLGLPIAYSIIRKHGGYIGFNSRLGEGTTFFFYIPASSGQERARPWLAEGSN